MPAQQPQTAFRDVPTDPSMGWGGYYNFKDKTMLPKNVLTFPSKNCFVPDVDKIVVREGEHVLGTAYTSVLFYNDTAGLFVMGDTVTGVSGATAVVLAVYGTDQLLVNNIVGNFVPGEVITGTPSGATGTLNTINQNGPIFGHHEKFANTTGQSMEITVYNQLDPPSTPLTTYQALWTDPETGIKNQVTFLSTIAAFLTRPIGGERIYFTEWFDDRTDVDGVSIGGPKGRLIWCDGTLVWAWSGAIAKIDTIVGSTITILGYASWNAAGFDGGLPTSPDLGFVVINGIRREIIGGSLATDSITLDDVTGITAGNIVADYSFPSNAGGLADTFDFAKTIENHVVYGNFNSRKLWGSNALNVDAAITLGGSSAVQDDLILRSTSQYTGTVDSIFRVTIDSVDPDIDEKTFISGGSGNLNDIIWNTSGYSGAAGAKNVYKFIVLGDFTVLLNGAMSAAPALGQVISGNISNAKGIIVSITSNLGNDVFGVRMTTPNGFVAGEGVTTSGGATGTIHPTSINTRYQNWIQLSQNDAIVPLDTGFGPLNVDNMVVSTLGVGNGMPDGIEAKFSNFYGHAIGDTFTLTIQTGGADTFKWQQDTGPLSTSVPITGAYQTLADGVQIKFVNKTGHSIGDSWDIFATPAVKNAWVDFYYSVPIRKPGQGFTVYLPSNFWTMEVQENVLYINDQSGKWTTLEANLSADLLTEAIQVVPLKYDGSLQVIYPYMLGYYGDYLCFVSMDKALKFLGRKKFIQLPQQGNLSDAVKLDFQRLTFEGGSIRYWQDKLWLTSPNDLTMMCFDKLKGYWQPPQEIPECAILSIVSLNINLLGDQVPIPGGFNLPTDTGSRDYLVAHSNIRNQTNVLFVGKNDNGNAFTVKMRTGSVSHGYRWSKKWANMTFAEGYMNGNPQIQFSLILGPNGCEGIQPHTMEPIYCNPPDRAPLGEGGLGSHPLGSDLAQLQPYFQEIFPCDMQKYYFIALDFECDTLDQDWALISAGVNWQLGQENNSQLTKNIPINIK